jgi:hypothetical protein
MRSIVTSLGVTLMALPIAWCPTFAQEPAAAPATGASSTPAMAKATQASNPSPPFVPADFKVPVLVEGDGFKLVPLGPDLVKIDFDAYMSSIDHLQKTFTRSTSWPHAGITAADAMQDMTTEQARFKKRASFAYAVLTPDGSRELGSVYVSPSVVPGYDATVRMWVTRHEYDAGFDARLYQWVTAWMKKDWPFTNVAYPGRAVDWSTWDALVAANKASKAGSGEQKL